jgi:pimeloyl-ACP methyl ester carboxylesterase
MHGWAGRATQFRKFIPVLNKEGFRVVGFDGPAHGQSEGTKTNIIEFEEAFKNLYAKVGEPAAIMAHSFGGGAVLYAAVNGLRVKKLINIASPTIGDEIINTYLRAINGSASTGEFFKSYMLRKYGKAFDEYTSSHLILKVKQDFELLLVHDEDDKEVGMEHPRELKRVYPKAKLYFTKGLGHTRILKDENVIKECVTFIKTGRLTAESKPDGDRL